MSRFSAAPASRLQILLVGLIVSMTWLKSPSVLCSTTGLPTLVDSSAPCPSDPAPSPNGPEEGRPVPGGKDRPQANDGEGGIAARRALGKLSASVRQIGIRRGTSVRVKQSKSQQIVPNAYATGSTTFAMRCWLRALTEGYVADVDGDRQPSAAARQLVTDMACLPDTARQLQDLW